MRLITAWRRADGARIEITWISSCVMGRRFVVEVIVRAVRCFPGGGAAGV
jgi:hypothetical protein